MSTLTRTLLVILVAVALLAAIAHVILYSFIAALTCVIVALLAAIVLGWCA